ncbi:hypothetical protein FACS1894137_04040 [Spirochaetia bacterium]|nr:hypothetical protein FACS1894137_04040 [Spirochaetia bacterium]
MDTPNVRQRHVYYAGMRSGATLADMEIVEWMWRHPPLCHKAPKSPEYRGRFPAYYKTWHTPEMKQAIDRILSRSPAAEITTYSIGYEMYYSDPRMVEETEQMFLSAALAGGKLPEEITEELFTVKKHQVIFRALVRLNRLGIIRKWNDNLSLLITFLSEMKSLDAAGGREYLVLIEKTAGIPSAIEGITLELLQLVVKREAAA